MLFLAKIFTYVTRQSTDQATPVTVKISSVLQRHSYLDSRPSLLKLEEKRCQFVSLKTSLYALSRGMQVRKCRHKIRVLELVLVLVLALVLE